MKKRMFSLVVSLYAFSLCADGGDDWEMQGLAWESKVRTLLAAARTNDILEVVRQNDVVFSPIRFADSKYAAEKFPQYLERYPNRLLVLQFEVLNVFYNAMDKDYDTHNPPFMFIDREGYNGSPDDFDSPEKWEAYKEQTEKRRAENKLRIQKDNRERSLRDYYIRLLWTIQTTIPLSRLPHVFTLLDKKIEDQALKRTIFVGVIHSNTGRSVSLLTCDNPPPPPIDGTRKFLFGLPPNLRQKIIDEVKTMYTEEELKILDAPYE